ncbi:MAG: hypothetical protein KDA93_23920 [Planctomycetaceae bacterium]|nr:hypothetical protein [Planctomycetaceae bacterium]
MKRVDIVCFDAASGHRTAAEALRTALSQAQPEWECRTIDVMDVLALDPTQMGKVIALSEHYFNWCMRREKYYGLWTCVLSAIWYSKLSARLFFPTCWGMSRFWKDAPPDGVISVTPLYNAMVYAAARRTNPQVECITIPVDYEEMTPGYWFEQSPHKRYILSSDTLLPDARRSHVPEDDIERVRGMIISPHFYDPPSRTRADLDAQFDLDPALPMGVVSFGCQGTVNVLRMAQTIADAKLPVNLICLCGHNKRLREMVNQLETPYPCVGVGYQPEPPSDFLHAADFAIGKPATMTVVEAAITQTPIIALKSDGLEAIHFSTESYIQATGTGVIADNFANVPALIEQVLTDKRFVEATQQEYHRGVFETAAVIERILGVPAAESHRKAA